MRDLVYLSPSDLKPYGRNAKKHSERQISALAEAIRKTQFNTPLVIDENNELLAGHGRLLAVKHLHASGKTFLLYPEGSKAVPDVLLDAQEKQLVPCYRIGGLTHAQKRAYRLADNRVTELGGGWDLKMLEIEFSALKDMKFDLDATGFDMFARQDVMREDFGDAEDTETGPQSSQDDHQGVSSGECDETYGEYDDEEFSAPDDFKEVDENIPTEFCCPKCNYKWSGKPS